MERQPHDYAAAMVFAQQQQAAHNQQQQFGFPPHQQFPPSGHGPPFIPPNASMQQYPFPPHMQRPHGLHPHPPPHHSHLHHQQPPSGFPPHMPPHLMPSPFPGPFDSAPPPAPPPSDPELQKVIDKLIEYYRKNGPEFEAMIRERQQDNPAYSFLFGGEGHNYYRYKLWLSTLPPSGPYNSPSSISMLRPPPNPMMSPSPLGGPIMNQPPFAPPYYEQHQHSQPFGGPCPPEYDQSSRTFKGLSGPLPSDVAMELSDVLSSLTGTKESIKGAKIWFMQRSPFAPALAEALRDRVFAMDDSERQLHIVYLANDILFDSLQRRINLHELDKEALAFKPVLGSMLGRIYHNPQNKGQSQLRLQKILQFWGSKDVFDRETIISLENDMLGISPTNLFTGPSKELSASLVDPSAAGLRQHATNLKAPHWQPDRQGSFPSFPQHPDKLGPPMSSFSGPSMPILSSVQPSNQQHMPLVPHLLASSAPRGEKLPPYPLFPPALIPGMVKKMQIGSGVPYSPMSPLDIPTVIPPSSVSESEILDRVSTFFKEIGEVNPSEGPTNSKDDDDDYEREGPVRQGGTCIPPPPNLQVDPETGTYADGSVDSKRGASGRLGLGAGADPNESQYDDVYSSYRKQRSTNYHTSMSARATTAK